MREHAVFSFDSSNLAQSFEDLRFFLADNHGRYICVEHDKEHFLDYIRHYLDDRGIEITGVAELDADRLLKYLGAERDLKCHLCQKDLTDISYRTHTIEDIDRTAAEPRQAFTFYFCTECVSTARDYSDLGLNNPLYEHIRRTKAQLIPTTVGRKMFTFGAIK